MAYGFSTSSYYGARLGGLGLVRLAGFTWSIKLIWSRVEALHDLSITVLEEF